MKKFLAFILCVGMAAAMTACGSSTDADPETTAAESTGAEAESVGAVEYDIKNYSFYEIDDFSQYIELGQYEGVKVNVTPSEEDIENKISQILTTYAQKTVVDEEAQTGDTVNMDFVGYMDGEAFANGSADAYDVIIGSHALIDGFEDGLIGAKAGDELSLNLTFPENYGNEAYAGKDAVFEVKVNSVSRKVVPELDDAFANSYNSAYATVEDFKNGVAEELKAANLEEDKLVSNAWNVVIGNCEVKDVPEELIQYYYESLYASYSYYVYYNYNYPTMEEYIEACDDITMEELTDTFMTQAQGYAVSELVYRAICADKGYEISDEEYDSFKAAYLETNNSEATDMEVRQGLLWEYAKNCVVDSVVCE